MSKKGNSFRSYQQEREGGGERKRKNKEMKKERKEKERGSGHYQLFVAHLHDSCNLLPLVPTGVYASGVVSTAVQ